MRPRHLDAAVTTDQASDSARVVPEGATVVKVGTAIIGYLHRPQRRQGFWTRNTQRLAEVEHLRAYRAMLTVEHGVLFAATDEDFLSAIMPELLLEAGLPRRPKYRANPITWATTITPALLDRRGVEWFDALEREFEKAGGRPKPLRADAIAKLLGVTWEERQACGFTTIGAIDMTKRQITAERRKANAARMRIKRERDGALPRESYLAGSVSAAKPWLALGLSRTAWYAQRNASGTSPCATFEAVNDASGTSPCAPYVNTWLATDLSQTADAIQFTFLSPVQCRDELRAALDGWTAGPMPPAIRTAYVSAKRRRAVRQEDVAQAIGISRPQLANSIQTTFNLSVEVIERLKVWLLSDDADLPPAPAADEARPARPHHRRGGKRPPDPGPVLPMLRLFAVIEGDRPAAAQVSAGARVAA